MQPAERADQLGNASAGDPAAPPNPADRNRVPAGLTREYRSESIHVQWFADRCIHSADCIRALPEVFDPSRRPWIDIDAADAGRIAAAVERCPTGALHYVRVDGGAQEAAGDEIVVRTIRNGPYLVRGSVRITAADGMTIREDTRVALCRCGQSKHMPFCDNSHRATGFRESR